MAELMATLSLFQALCLAVLTLSGYIVIQVVYRLTLHPLAKYPGPFISKISDWSIPWQCATRDRHLFHLKEHQKYGPIVRIGPNTLSFSSPRSLRQIYQSGRENNPLRKAAYYDTVDAPTGAYSLHSETSRSKHAARRRVLDHAFTAQALRSNEPYLIDAVETFCTVLIPDNEQEWLQPRNMREYFNWFAYDVMGALVFGRKFDCLTDSAHRFVPNMVVTSGVFLYISSNLPLQWIVRPLISSPLMMKWLGSQLARDGMAYNKYANECMAQCLAEHKEAEQSEPLSKRKDIMHYIIEARNSEATNYGRRDLDSDASLLIAAGSDTTSTTLAGLMFYLTLPSSAGCLKRLINEVRDKSRFPDISSLTGPAVTTLPYLRACIDEALRLAPPAAIHLPRTIARQPGLEIDGQFVPTGTTVGASAYVLHHDELAYPGPWSFTPDRWILEDTSDSKKAEQIAKAREAFTPFSFGSRGCIGKDLAYREMCLCMARLVYMFDFKRAYALPPDGETLDGRKVRAGMKVRADEYQLYDCFLVERDGPEVVFRRAQA